MEKRAAAAAASPARKETGISDSTRRDDRLRLLRDSLQVRPRSAHGDHLPVAEDAGEENASRRTGGKERGSPSARSFIDRSTTARTRPLPLFFQHSALSLLHVFFACSLKNRRFRAVAHTVAIKDRKRARDVEERRERLDRKSGGGPTAAAAAALSIRRLSLSLSLNYPDSCFTQFSSSNSLPPYPLSILSFVFVLFFPSLFCHCSLFPSSS